MSISSVAREALGLTRGESQTFFAGRNSIEDLKFKANEMCEGRGLPLMFPNLSYEPESEDLPY
jgi:hypothetical protein